MLLIYQSGSVKIGEVVRYTVTYTPSQDRILPSPEKLHVRIRNTSAIALRAAFVHGPYTLSVAAYPSGFSPNEKFANPRRYGVPEFEPMLKAGGSWECELVVPDDIRQSAGMGQHGGFGKGPEAEGESASWVIEVSSQVIFSTSAAVGYEVLVARDHKSLHLGHSIPVVSGQSQMPQAGLLSDYQQSIGAKDGHHPGQPKGIFSRAVRVKVEDTATLWNTPRLPEWDDAGDKRLKSRPGADKPVESMVNTGDKETKEDHMPRKQKKVHLVILTHGLHSNLGADMLFMKESIDAAAKQARVDAKARRAREAASRGRATSDSASSGTTSNGETAPKSDNSSAKGKETDQRKEDDKQDDYDDDDDDDEEVIVRGYSGNATKTERGIKYLGKRLARYVLSLTYPDQPFLPVGKDMAEHPNHLAKAAKTATDTTPVHKHSTIHAGRHRDHHASHKRPYQITSISFVAHSLGGLVQTYAVAYIQKHSPHFFDKIKPINFIALATPFLGLSNENPMYVKFALDFGLVGRTGKDLGLTWRAPTIARSGWGAIVGNLGETAHKKVYGDSQPDSKPLLRILPTGPAHTALKKFRNRTVYSNVVNDGIVPLRTSCLLFLDWHGLGRVDKARRDAGLVETVVGFGWAELTGTNMANHRQRQLLQAGDEQTSDSGATTPKSNMLQVPQPSDDAVHEDDRASITSVPTPYNETGPADQQGYSGIGGPFSGFFNLFRSNEPPKPQTVTQKQKKIYDRSQTLQVEEGNSARTSARTSNDEAETARPAKATTGQEFEEEVGGILAPPRTTFFESAGDVLNPHVPDVAYLLDPSKRPRTIFHDRVYHPTDIPAPPMKRRTSPILKRRTFPRIGTGSSQSTSAASTPPLKPQDSNRSSSIEQDSKGDGQNSDAEPEEVVDAAGMRVEEKIARGYHRDLAWRKVLVKLEPDAHNNIFVRRMFTNAYGWPVVKHIVDAHFSDSAIARMSTDDEYLGERAKDINQPPDEHGGETKADPSARRLSLSTAAATETVRSESEAREALDDVPDLPSSQYEGAERSTLGDRVDSMTWSDRDWQDSEYESDVDFSSDGGAKSKLENSKDWNWTEKIVGKGKTKVPPPTAGNTREAETDEGARTKNAEIKAPSTAASKSAETKDADATVTDIKVAETKSTETKGAESRGVETKAAEGAR